MVETLMRNNHYSGSHVEAFTFDSKGVWFEFRKVGLLIVLGLP